MQPTQFLNNIEPISTHIKVLEFHMPVAGSMLENLIGPGARRSHEMDRIGPLLSSMPAGWVVAKHPSPSSGGHTQ